MNVHDFDSCTTVGHSAPSWPIRFRRYPVTAIYSRKRHRGRTQATYTPGRPSSPKPCSGDSGYRAESPWETSLSRHRGKLQFHVPRRWGSSRGILRVKDSSAVGLPAGFRSSRFPTKRPYASSRAGAKLGRQASERPKCSGRLDIDVRADPEEPSRNFRGKRG